MHASHKKLAEGRNIVVIHNHPNNSGASLADLSAAAWLDAEYMMIVNPDGAVHRHKKIGDAMVELEPIHNLDYVAPADPQETAMDSIAYWIQSLREIGNPPEMVFEQGKRIPNVLDYIDHAQGKQTERAPIDRDYVQFDPVHHRHNFISGGAQFAQELTAPGISLFAQSAKDSGFDIAGKLIQHFLGGSGEPYEVSVDEMLVDLPLFRQSIMDYVGFSLGDHFPPSNAEDSNIKGTIIEEFGQHSVYSYSLPWRQVGIGKPAKDDIFDFDGNLPANLETLQKLSQGEPLDENATQEAFDWYLAVNKIFYYPRVTIVLDNITGNAEVGLVIEVRDHYAWYEDTGPLNAIMADLEKAGLGRNFPVLGESSPIIGGFNLNEKTAKNEDAYYRLHIDGWNEDA